MGKYNPAIHHRNSIRLKGYDYSRAGFYFVTMNTQNSGWGDASFTVGGDGEKIVAAELL